MVRFYKYQIKASYIIQPMLTGFAIDEVENFALKEAKCIFQKLESATVLIPTNQQDLKQEMVDLFLSSSIEVQKGIRNASTQYFVNCQLETLLRDSQSPLTNWQIRREHNYSSESKHTVDLKISHNSGFNIWVESDNARDDQIYKKLWEKLPIILDHGEPASDFYVPLIYSTTSEKDDKVTPIAEKVIKSIKHNIRVQGIITSFAILYIDKETKEGPIEAEISIKKSSNPALFVAEIV
ncbi:MAG: hypothetical protein ACOCRK_10045 [bacterium]